MTGFAAGFTHNILPGLFFGLIGLRSPERDLDARRMLLSITEAAVFKPPDPERSPSRAIRHSMNDAFVPLGTAVAHIAVHVLRAEKSTAIAALA